MRKQQQKHIIESEIRNSSGAYKTQLLREAAIEIEKNIKEIFEAHKGNISVDAIHTLINDASFAHLTTIIAFEID